MGGRQELYEIPNPHRTCQPQNGKCNSEMAFFAAREIIESPATRAIQFILPYVIAAEIAFHTHVNSILRFSGFYPMPFLGI